MEDTMGGEQVEGREWGEGFQSSAPFLPPRGAQTSVAAAAAGAGIRAAPQLPPQAEAFASKGLLSWPQHNGADCRRGLR